MSKRVNNSPPAVVIMSVGNADRDKAGIGEDVGNKQ
jgi:hypothetical protein